MNQYPLWKNLLVLAVILTGFLFALPNVFDQDPSLEVAGTRHAKLDRGTMVAALDALKIAGVPVKSQYYARNKMLLRFADSESQLRAQEVLAQELGSDYAQALTLSTDIPGWLRAAGALPMNLGLDLRGGIHVLIDVDMDAAVKKAAENYAGEIRTLLRNEKLRYVTVSRGEAKVSVKFRDGTVRDAAVEEISDEFRDLIVEARDEGDSFFVDAKLGKAKQQEVRKFALAQNITTLRNRVNALGVAEPVIQQQGHRRIVVQLPGVQDPGRIKGLLSATATLEYRLEDTGHSVQDAVAGRIPPGSRLYYTREGRPVLLKKRVIVTGDQITNASSGLDQRSGQPAVFVNLDGSGARRMRDVTTDNVGKPMAVVFIETRHETSRDESGQVKKTKKKVEEVISIATIQEPFGRRFQTTGLDSTEEARDLALLLRAGALAAPIEIVEERTIGPSLGQDNIDQGFLSVIIGLVLVMIFMVFYYRLFGLVADMALALNLVLIVAVLSMLQATLTLPGIAGIVLTVGMAVDANVLIFERIREEIRVGNTPQASIHAGYAKALSTIMDANITTLIAAAVLFSFGTGPIKGFAVTLFIGILTSMFTAILGTRAVINFVYGGKRVERLSI